MYTKIFLSFLAVLFITELLIFIFFLAIPAHRFGRRLETFVKEKVLTVKSLVEERVHTIAGFPSGTDPELQEFASTLGRLLEAKLWITDAQGQVVEKSFTGPIPDFNSHQNSRRLVYEDDFQLYRLRHFEFYAVIPFSYGMSHDGRINLFFENRGLPPPLSYFALGLALVGLLIAILVIPVARPITRRINQLRHSTLRIADGDLSHRVAVTGRDEITELGRSFNQMAAKLESMINNGKEMIANISHELRTPLSRIRVSEEMLRQKLEHAKQAPLTRHLNDILEDIEHLDALVGRILELSKLEMRAAPMVFRPLDLCVLIMDAAEKHRPRMEQRQLTLEMELSDHRMISGDAEALATVFSNLMDNAVKYTPENGVIHIASAPEPDRGIILSNTCDPLNAEELVRIFNPFQRVCKTTAAGSGLGLAIAKKIIEAHGGDITAHNTSHGLAFLIHLQLTTP